MANGIAANVPGNKSWRNAAPNPNWSSNVVGHKANRFASSPTADTLRNVSAITGRVKRVALTLVAKTRWTAWNRRFPYLKPDTRASSQAVSGLEHRINPRVAEKESSNPTSAPA